MKFTPLLKPIPIKIDFLWGFIFVWNRLPRCAICHKDITIGDELQWYAAYRGRFGYRAPTHRKCSVNQKELLLPLSDEILIWEGVNSDDANKQGG